MADGIPDALSLKPVDYDPFASETYANPALQKIIGGLVNQVATLPQRAIQNSQYSLDTGTYDPSVPVEAALTAMTGGVAGTGEGGMALGAGPIRAYHGSPHDFDKFSMDKIGTGEGAQAYGHGMYFAEHEPVAQQYRDQLKWKGASFDDPQVIAQNSIDRLGDRESAAKSLESAMASTNAFHRGKLPASQVEANKATQQAIDLLRSDAPITGKAPTPGKMYEVNINADPEHFLDWDKPLSEQHPQTQDAVKQAMGSNWDQFKFANARDAVKQGFIAPGKETTAANLREAGIPGIKYLDQGSRGAGEGSRNYVVFDDNLINIVKKYGLAGVSMLPPAAASFLSQRIKPVDHNPFAQGGNPALTPVDNDPFNPDQKT